MTGSEILSTIFHLDSFLKNGRYIQLFQSLQQITTQLKTDLNKSWDAEISNVIDQMTIQCVQYESTTGFPFENNQSIELFHMQGALGTQNLTILKHELVNDLTNAEAKVTALFQSLSNGKNTVSTIKGALDQGKVNTYKGYFKHDESKSIVKVEFQHSENQSVEEITELMKEFQKNLELIGRFDKRSRESMYSVHSISKSSPLVVELLVWTGLAYTVLKAINEALLSVERIQKIRLHQEELRKLKLDKQDAIDALLDEERSESKKVQAAAASTIIENLDDNRIDGAKNEVEKAVKEGIAGIQNLIVNGGHVTVYLTAESMPESSDQPRDLIRLKQETANAEKQLKEIRRIEGSVDKE